MFYFQFVALQEDVNTRASYVTAHGHEGWLWGEGRGCSQPGWPCKHESSKHQELHARGRVCFWEFSSWLSSSHHLGIWYAKETSTSTPLDFKKWPESSSAFPCCSPSSSQQPGLVLMMLLQISSKNTSKIQLQVVHRAVGCQRGKQRWGRSCLSNLTSSINRRVKDSFSLPLREMA